MINWTVIEWFIHTNCELNKNGIKCIESTLLIRVLFMPIVYNMQHTPQPNWFYFWKSKKKFYENLLNFCSDSSRILALFYTYCSSMQACSDFISTHSSGQRTVVVWCYFWYKSQVPVITYIINIFVHTFFFLYHVQGIQ